MKVWRNSEGREFSVWDEGNSSGTRFSYANVSGSQVSRVQMEILGYELVEKEPEDQIKPEGIICELRVGIAKNGPYFTLQNHDAQGVCLTIWPHQVEAIWRPMCEQLGIPYVAPDWDALGEKR